MRRGNHTGALFVSAGSVQEFGKVLAEEGKDTGRTPARASRSRQTVGSEPLGMPRWLGPAGLSIHFSKHL